MRGRAALFALGLFATPLWAQETSPVPVAGEARPERTWGPGARVRWPGPDLELALVGFAQVDFRGYPNWETDDEDRSERSELRRARLGLDGEWQRLSFETMVDFSGDEGHLKDLWAEVKIVKGLRLRAGNFKLPVSAERLTPVAKLDFIERSRLGDELSPNRDWGLMAHGSLRKRAEYALGLFKGDDRTGASRAGTTVATRLQVAATSDLDLAASFSRGEVEAPDALAEPDAGPRGLAGTTFGGYRYFPRKFVNGTRRRLGLDGSWRHGPFAARAEMLEAREERLGQGSVCQAAGGRLLCDDLPQVIGRGYSASATWLLTGEKKKRTVEPKRPLFRGPGALEVGVRAERVRFDDDGPEGGFAGAGDRARNLRPSGQDALTFGLNWWPRAWARLMANFVVERFEDELLAPESGRRGGYRTLLLRLQLQVP